MKRFSILLIVIPLIVISCQPVGVSSASTPPPTNTLVSTGTPLLTKTLLPTFTPTLTFTPTPIPKPITLENAEQITEIKRFGDGVANQIALSPDGNFLAVAGGLGIWILDSQTLEDIHLIQTGFIVDSIAFSPDGTFLASATRGRLETYGFAKTSLVQIWQTADWTLSETLKDRKINVNSVFFSPDGKYLLTVGGDKTTFKGQTTIWQVDKWSELRSLDGSQAVISGDSTMIALTNGSFMTLRSMLDWQVLLKEIDVDGKPYDSKSPWIPIFDIGFSLDNKTFAAGLADGSIRLYNIVDGTMLRKFESSGAKRKIVFSPDGTILAGGSDDGTIRLWSISDGSLLKTLDGQNLGVLSATFSKDSGILTTLTFEGSVQIWDVLSGSLVKERKSFTREVNSLAFSPDGSILASGYDDGSIFLWRASDGTLLRKLVGHLRRVKDLAFSPDGALLASASEDSTARVWRVSDGMSLFALTHDQKWITTVSSVDFSSDGTMLASGSWEGLIYIWHVSNGSLVNTIDAQAETNSLIISGIAFSPDDTILISSFGEGSIRFWQISDSTLQKTIPAQSNVYDLKLSSDGSLFATASSDGKGKIWRAKDGALLQSLGGHQFPVESVAFSEGGIFVATASADSTIKLWEVSSGKDFYKIDAYAPVTNVIFSPNGAYLVSGSIDGTIRFWGLP